MALLGREFIAVPDDRKNQIVFKWPDHNIRKYTRAIVNADELAMFVNTGQVVGTMGPGRHQIDADEIPGLGVAHRLRHGRQRLQGRAVLRRHPRVSRQHLRRPHRRRAGPPDRDDRHPAGLRRLLDAGQGSGRPDHQPGRHRRRRQQRGHHRLDERPAAQGDAHPHDGPDRSQRLAHPRPVGLHARHRGRGDGQGQRAAGHLRRRHHPHGQLRHQPVRAGRDAAEDPGQGHRLLPPGRQLPAVRGRRDGPRGRRRAWRRGAPASAGPSWPPASGWAARPPLRSPPGRRRRPDRASPAAGPGFAGAGRAPGSSARAAMPATRPAPSSAPRAAPRWHPRRPCARAARPRTRPAPSSARRAAPRWWRPRPHCTSCGTEMAAGRPFCPSCGTAAGGGGASARPPPPPIRPAAQ